MPASNLLSGPLFPLSFLCGRKEAGRRWKELGSSDFVLLQEEI